MKKNSLIIAICILCFGIWVNVSAETSSFITSLGFKSANKVEVMKLQNFLIGQGLLVGPATGNYLTLTQNAVKTFQASHGIEATGYFGPLTRVAATAILAQTTSPAPSGSAQVTITSVSDESNQLTSAAVLSKSKTIRWQTSGYPTNVGVNVNLLRKTSNVPSSYIFVRRIAENTVNDGQEVWVPQTKELDGTYYVEVACSHTYEFKQGCQFSGGPMQVN